MEGAEKVKVAKTAVFNCRMTKRERRWLDEIAASHGLSASSYFRMHVRKARRAQRRAEKGV